MDARTPGDQVLDRGHGILVVDLPHQITKLQIIVIFGVLLACGAVGIGLNGVLDHRGIRVLELVLLEGYVRVKASCIHPSIVQ